MDLHQFACECCGEVKMDPVHMGRLEKIFDRMGVDVPLIARGYYCEKFRHRAPGYEASKHCDGVATDFHIFGQYFRHKFLSAALPLFDVVVIYPRYVHLETVLNSQGSYCLVM